MHCGVICLAASRATTVKRSKSRIVGSAADALVFMAVAGGGESLSRDDLVRAFERLGITGEPSL